MPTALNFSVGGLLDVSHLTVWVFVSEYKNTLAKVSAEATCKKHLFQMLFEVQLLLGGILGALIRDVISGKNTHIPPAK